MKMSEEIPFADLDYQSKIDKIYHISDIHIRLQKRHDEYKKVFTNLYNSLKDEVKKNNNTSMNGIIIITGDILHSKTELSPECVSLTADFFQKLSKIMPLVIMAGNHDANLNNNNRMDSLTPIVEKVARVIDSRRKGMAIEDAVMQTFAPAPAPVTPEGVSPVEQTVPAAPATPPPGAPEQGGQPPAGLADLLAQLQG
jgi:predicted MPP superfamily phosphohydrolase